MIRLAAAALSVCWASATLAQTGVEVPGAVPMFKQICLTGGLDPAARPAALAAAGWTKEVVSVDVSKLGISKAIDRNYDLSKPESSEQWTGTLDGRSAKVVLATYSAKRPHHNLCALTVEGIKNAMPYGGDLRDAFKEFGIGAKSVDLVHYYEFAGRVGPDSHRVRGEVFSRSLATGGRDTMHIYVAY